MSVKFHNRSSQEVRNYVATTGMNYHLSDLLNLTIEKCQYVWFVQNKRFKLIKGSKGSGLFLYAKNNIGIANIWSITHSLSLILFPDNPNMAMMALSIGVSINILSINHKTDHWMTGNEQYLNVLRVIRAANIFGTNLLERSVMAPFCSDLMEMGTYNR